MTSTLTQLRQRSGIQLRQRSGTQLRQRSGVAGPFLFLAMALILLSL